MADWGIKFTKIGGKATSTNEYDYNLWSKYAVAKIIKEGDGITSGPASVGYSQSNNPIWMVYGSEDNSEWYFCGNNCPIGSAFSFLDADSLTVDPYILGDFYYKYFMMVDSFEN